MAVGSGWHRLRDVITTLTGWRAIAATGSGAAAPPPDRPAKHDGSTDSEIRLVRNDAWVDSDKMPLDPRLRVALEILARGDPRQVFERTGIRLPDSASAEARVGVILQLPVLLELSEPLTIEVRKALAQLQVAVADAYATEAERNDDLRCVTATVDVEFRGRGIEIERLHTRVRRIVDLPFVRRLALPGPLLSCEAASLETLDDFGLPADRTITVDGNDFVADGTGVIVGIIDDGCALAHWDFVRAGPASRVVAIWDQGRRSPAGAWQAVTDFGYGCELLNAPSSQAPGPIDAALRKHTNAEGVIAEDAVYDEIDFRPYAALAGRPFNPSTHGTHVMGVAAGSGGSLFGKAGVAPAAEIIFVQLPPELIAAGGAILTKLVHDGAQYIFDRAARRAKALGVPVPAVVNISYGN